MDLPADRDEVGRELFGGFGREAWSAFPDIRVSVRFPTS